MPDYEVNITKSFIGEATITVVNAANQDEAAKKAQKIAPDLVYEPLDDSPIYEVQEVQLV